jgi:hypothetical protein
VITYNWRVSAIKPLLRWLSWLLRPVFAANHRWAMARGEESLRPELRRRRRATSETERRRVPPPPPTTFRWLIGRQPPEQDRPRFTSRLRAFARVNPWLGARNVADVVRVRSEAVRSGGGLAG